MAMPFGSFRESFLKRVQLQEAPLEEVLSLRVCPSFLLLVFLQCIIWRAVVRRLMASASKCQRSERNHSTRGIFFATIFTLQSVYGRRLTRFGRLGKRLPKGPPVKILYIDGEDGAIANGVCTLSILKEKESDRVRGGKASPPIFRPAKKAGKTH